jgi:RNase P subunit RPR2
MEVLPMKNDKTVIAKSIQVIHYCKTCKRFIYPTQIISVYHRKPIVVCSHCASKNITANINPYLTDIFFDVSNSERLK